MSQELLFQPPPMHSYLTVVNNTIGTINFYYYDDPSLLLVEERRKAVAAYFFRRFNIKDHVL